MRGVCLVERRNGRAEFVPEIDQHFIDTRKFPCENFVGEMREPPKPLRFGLLDLSTVDSEMDGNDRPDSRDNRAQEQKATQ